MLNYAAFKHNEISERIVKTITDKLGTPEKDFFRIHVAYYFSLVASSMRATIAQSGSATPRLINNYSINLGPSGVGKSVSSDIIEDEILGKFRERFLDQTWEVTSEINLGKLAAYRARKYQTDDAVELTKVQREFSHKGMYEFSFHTATEAAIKQLREKLLMANIGSMNLQVDEIGLNLLKAKDALPAFLELYEGKLKKNLTKNTSESTRSETIFGSTPTNMMLFGVPNALLDQGKNNEEFMDMLSQGYARRCFFGYISDEQLNAQLNLEDPAARLQRDKQMSIVTDLSDLSDYFVTLADPVNAHISLAMPDDTTLLYYTYDNECRERAYGMNSEDYTRRYEMQHRATKALKLAGAYAFVDKATCITDEHFKSAIKISEMSGLAFERILHREEPHVKLAKYLGKINREITEVGLREKLPFFKPGTKSTRQEMLRYAIDWGYSNNIAIKRRFTNGVELYSGELLQSNDLTKMRLSVSSEFTENYASVSVPWEKLAVLGKTYDKHWINHHLEDGFDGVGYRSNENCIPGFNMIVLDVDQTYTIQSIQKLLKDYRAFYYLSKRHTPQNHRFRVILPINYTLELSADDFAAFMQNVYQWLPFTSDEATGQRSRKWLTHASHHSFTSGILLDALPFIPNTSMEEQYHERIVNLQNLSGLERWFIFNTSRENSNRNNNLLRYALILVDGGLDSVGVRDRVLALNNQIDMPLPDAEIDKTIMKTVSKQLQTKTP